MEDLERYKLTKNIAKKSVSQPNYRAYDYQDVQLGTKKGEKGIYKFPGIKSKTTRNLEHVRR